MSKKIMIDTLGWGLLLWLIGYCLGIIFFIITPDLIGWLLTPIGILLTLFVLFKKIKSTSLAYYLVIGIIWTAIAIIGDFLFIVKTFNTPDYYKFDIYLYYTLTFALPLLVGFFKSHKKQKTTH